MGKKRGPKKIKIDWEEFDKLCAMQCTLPEIANWFGCSEDTIERRCKEEKKLKFAEYFNKKRVGGKVALRRAQFQSATKGNSSLLIWLGKQYLGQKDNPDDVNAGENVTFNVNFGKKPKRKPRKKKK